MLDYWDNEREVVVVNPYLGWNLYDIPGGQYSHIFILCTTLDQEYREMIIPRIEENYDDIRMFKSDPFGRVLNEQGQQQLFKLIETVARYHKLDDGLMTIDEYEDMVRNHPKPDAPSYYSLKVWSYEKSRQWKDKFTRVIVDSYPSYH